MEINKETITDSELEAIAAKARRADELEEQLKTAEQARSGLTEELKEERKKKQDAIELAKAAANAPEDEEKIRKVAEAIINEKETKQIEMSRLEFESNFKKSHPEFQESNDPAGLKYTAFKKVLSRFNLNGLSKIEEFQEVYSDALRLLGKGESKQEGSQSNAYAFTVGGSKSIDAGATLDEVLTSQELKLVEQVGWTKDKYLKLKIKNPDYVRGLLQYVKP